MLLRLTLLALSYSLAFAGAPTFVDETLFSLSLCCIDADAKSEIFLIIMCYDGFEAF